MVRWQDDDELLEPMPPPPAPQAHPQDRGSLTPRRRNPQHRTPMQELDESLAPQTPPMPHTHPLVALSDESARNVKLQQDAGGMAIRSSQKMFRHRPVVSGERLDSTFFSRARVAAFVDRGELPESDSPFAVETEHSSRAIALQLQRQVEKAEKEVPMPTLDEQERTVAATEASARRHELLRVSRWDTDSENCAGLGNGALARASERKVPKQLNAKWVQARQEPSNRPKGPLERPEERDLRETLFRITASDVLQSGVLYDEADAARNSSFAPLRRPRLPMVTSGIIGLPGCCFEKY